MEAPRVRRVAVIGAGPAGAITTDALIKEQFFEEIRVFERKSVAGGTWVHNPTQQPRILSLQNLIDGKADLPTTIPQDLPCETQRSTEISSHQLRFSDSGVYENLHSNLPPSTMSFTQEPLPDTVSQQALSRYGAKAPFRHRSVIQKWIHGIFTKTGSHEMIEFNTTVELAKKCGTKWVLTLRKERSDTQRDQWWQEEFDALIVASGHYSIPYMPDIPGLAQYSLRSPGSIQHSKHFRSARDYTNKNVVVVGGSVSAFDALHEIRTVSKHPVIASLRQPLAAFGWAPFTHPHLEVRPPIASVEPESRSVVFEDGSKIENVDVIFFATGYDFSFPFLPDVKIRNRRLQGLYQHVFSIDDPSLGFIGMVSGGLTFRVFEWQAVALARFFAGRAVLPTKNIMQEWESHRVSAVQNDLAFSNIASDYEGYFECLRALAGDPAEGTSGRMLPRFEMQWVEEFQAVVRARIKWWQSENRRAEEMKVDSKLLTITVDHVSQPEEALP